MACRNRIKIYICEYKSLIMKTLATLLLLVVSSHAFAQLKLNDKEFKNLVGLSQAYAADNNANGEGFDTSVKKFSNAKLKPLVDVMVLLDGGDKSLLTPKYLSKPSAEALQLWYVVDAVQSSRNDSLNTKTDEQIAKAALAEKVDERLLVHNYYRKLNGGIAFLSNEADMSATNIDINKLGLKNDTEKGIFFLNMADALITRFRVLNQMKNPDKLMEFAAKLPKFNGEPYYKFTAFGYDDFEYTNDNGTSTYNTVFAGSYYDALISHFMAAADKEDIDLAKDIYFGSILTKPEFFKFSSAADMLQTVYDDAGKD